MPLGSGLANTGVITPERASRVGFNGLIFREDFTSPRVSMFNDAHGIVWRDNTITFCGKPSLRIDPVGNTTANSDPGQGPDTAGVICKRRLGNLIRGVYSWEGWIRWTSQNNTSNVFTTVSNYNRDGVNAYYPRIWIDTTSGGAASPPYVGFRYLGSDGLWHEFGRYNTQVATHMYDPIGNPGKEDDAGGWHFFRSVTDFTNLQYQSFQFNDVIWGAGNDPSTGGASTLLPLNGAAVWQAADTGARFMHWSVEFSQKTATRRFINVADLAAEQFA